MALDRPGVKTYGWLVSNRRNRVGSIRVILHPRQASPSHILCRHYSQLDKLTDRDTTMNLTSGASNNSATVTSGDSVVALIEKGNALEEQGRPEEAMECYEAAVHADQRCARGYPNRGNIL